MVNSGLFAFCAADSTINATGKLKEMYERAESQHFSAALAKIFNYCRSDTSEDELWYTGGKLEYLPVMATLMTVVAHGVSDVADMPPTAKRYYPDT